MSYAFTTNSYYTASDGGLTTTRATTSSTRTTNASPLIGVGSKLYWEFVVGGNVSRTYSTIGLVQSGYSATSYLGSNTFSYGYHHTGQKVSGAWFQAYGDPFTDGDVIGIAVDMKSAVKKIWFSKNGVWQGGGDPEAGTGEAFSWTDTSYRYIGVSTYYSGIFYTLREAAAAYSYPAPEGFKILLFDPFGDCDIPLIMGGWAGAQAAYAVPLTETGHVGAQGGYAIPLTMNVSVPARGDFLLKQLSVAGATGAIGDFVLKQLVAAGYVGLQGGLDLKQLVVGGSSGAAGTVRLPKVFVEGSAFSSTRGEFQVQVEVSGGSGAMGDFVIPKLETVGAARAWGTFTLPKLTNDGTAFLNHWAKYDIPAVVSGNAGAQGDFYYAQSTSLITATAHQTYTYTGTMLDDTGFPAVCEVVAFSETDHNLVGSTTTDPATGGFTLTVDASSYLVFLLGNVNRNAITVMRGEVFA